MTKIHDTVIIFEGEPLLVRYSIQGYEPDVGLFGLRSTNHTLHDPETGERFDAIERHLGLARWESIIAAIDNLLRKDEDEYWDKLVRDQSEAEIIYSERETD